MMRVPVRVGLAVAAVLGVGLAAAMWLSRGPSIEDFAHLREPRLTRLPDQRVLVIEVTGDPNIVGGGAFEALFRAYYRLDSVSRLSRPPAPRARWPQPEGIPKAEWRGQYALPIPDGVTNSAQAEREGTQPVTATWAYGDVAEVLHVGPYSAEQPTIERLHAFVRQRGYRVVGEHEEEYVKGPGMVFAGDPSSYLTVIRLRVERAGS